MRSRARLPRRSLAVAFTASLAACSGGGGGAGSVLPTASTAPSTSHATATIPQLQAKIKHVIVVILENRSFDNIFATYPNVVPNSGADIASLSTGYASYHGTPETLTPASLSDSSYDVDHSHQGFMTQYDGGKNDGFTPPGMSNPEIAYVPQGEVQPYFDIAKQQAISDRFFHGVTAPTFPSHLEIGAATTYGIIDNPSDNTWGCDAKPGTTTGLFDPAAADEEDHNAGPFPCFDELSIFDLLDRGVPKPITWRYYVSREGTDITGNLNIAAYFRHIRYGPDWNSDIAANDAQAITDMSMVTSTATDNFPQVSFIIPDDASTDHAGTPSLGPTYIEQLVNAFGSNTTLYDNSLMIITWDDWGGWYDHVIPPIRADGSHLSFRKPVLLIGGYTKQGYVSHVQTEDASIAKTIENLFGLGSLGAHDVAANDFSDVFDVTTATQPHAYVPVTSVQGNTVPVGNPPLTLGSHFRVVPADLLYHRSGDFDDYYGKRSADY